MTSIIGKKIMWKLMATPFQHSLKYLISEEKKQKQKKTREERVLKV